MGFSEIFNHRGTTTSFMSILTLVLANNFFKKTKLHFCGTSHCFVTHYKYSSKVEKVGDKELKYSLVLQVIVLQTIYTTVDY